MPATFKGHVNSLSMSNNTTAHSALPRLSTFTVNVLFKAIFSGA